MGFIFRFFIHIYFGFGLVWDYSSFHVTSFHHVTYLPITFFFFCFFFSWADSQTHRKTVFFSIELVGVDSSFFSSIFVIFRFEHVVIECVLTMLSNTYYTITFYSVQIVTTKQTGWNFIIIDHTQLVYSVYLPHSNSDAASSSS